MTRKNLLTTFVFLMLAITTVSGQALKVTTTDIDMLRPLGVNNLTTRDGLDISTKNSTSLLGSGSDLIWGCFYQTQPNNPGIFSLTSLSSPSGWNPCFTVRANGKVGIMNSNPSVALEIGSASSLQQVKVNGTIVWGSDVRMKENINGLSNSLGRLTKLRGVSYNLKEEVADETIPEKILNDPSFNSAQGKGVLKKSPKKNSGLQNRTVYGFLAQEVQQLFPELVYQDDSTGMLSVDYIGIIPLLLDGLKEQQGQIEALQTEVTTQKEQIASILQAIGAGKLNASEGSDSFPILHQNTPNPFDRSTEIGFYIPREVLVANLYIFDMHGNQKKSFPIHARENGSIAVDGSTLNAGIYFYTLICDSKPVDTKQMILTK